MKIQEDAACHHGGELMAERIMVGKLLMGKFIIEESMMTELIRQQGRAGWNSFLHSLGSKEKIMPALK